MSCSSIEQNKYVCGERYCMDRKELNEYFESNLTIEIATKKNRKKKSFDLVKLNTDNSDSIIEKKISIRDKIIKKKIKKENLESDKRKILEQRKKRKVQEKIRKKEEKLKVKALKSENDVIKINPSKSDNNIERGKNIASKPPVLQNNNKKIQKNKIKINSHNNENLKSVCEQIDDCDIDKIAEMLIKKGKAKPFPNISSN